MRQRPEGRRRRPEPGMCWGEECSKWRTSKYKALWLEDAQWAGGTAEASLAGGECVLVII